MEKLAWILIICIFGPLIILKIVGIILDSIKGQQNTNKQDNIYSINPIWYNSLESDVSNIKNNMKIFDKKLSDYYEIKEKLFSFYSFNRDIMIIRNKYIDEVMLKGNDTSNFSSVIVLDNMIKKITMMYNELNCKEKENQKILIESNNTNLLFGMFGLLKWRYIEKPLNNILNRVPMPLEQVENDHIILSNSIKKDIIINSIMNNNLCKNNYILEKIINDDNALSKISKVIGFN